MKDRVYTILVLDETYIENHEVYVNVEDAKKSFKKHLKERGLGIIKQRAHLKEEFYREGEWQIQLIKAKVNV
jgi:hypothetical protein